MAKRRKTKPDFKLYAGDGGGCFGITPSYLNHYHNYIDKFDGFIGTSIHAALCAGYALGYTATQTHQFMLDELPNIFHRSWYSWRRMSPFGPKYSDAELNRALKNFLSLPNGEPAKMKHVKKPLFITAMNFKYDRPKVFESIDPDDAELLLWEVVRCSVAANTYFATWCPYHDGREDFFTDGGLWANAPNCPGLAAVVRRLNVPIDRVKIFSVGTADRPSPDRNQASVDNYGKLRMVGPFIDSVMEGGNEKAMNAMTKSFIKDKFIRFPGAPTDPGWGMDDPSLIDDIIDRSDALQKDYLELVKEATK